eukprot:m.7617 g.7617  ORF g.7617 m.7617 type:complete len:257 (-) comp2993_c0_seq1:53-823(-)
MAPGGVRADGRNDANTLRALGCELGPLSRADGSAQFAMGATVALAAVYGPGDVSARREKPDRAAIEVSYKPKVGLPGVACKKIERHLHHVLEEAILTHLHPRACISLIVQEISDDGGMLACAVNAACLALMDAGVSLTACFASVSCAFGSFADDELAMVLDPSQAESKDAETVVTFGFMMGSPETSADGDDGTVVLSATQGVAQPDKVMAAVDLCHEASKAIASFYRLANQRRLSKETITSQEAFKVKNQPKAGGK